MTKVRGKSGIQRKYLKYTVALLLLALLLSSAGVVWYVRQNLTNVIIDQYSFMSEKMGLTLDSLFQKTDEVTAECIVDEYVQKSLKVNGLQEVERNGLGKYFAYIDLEHVAEYCYVDNKENVYTRSYSKISYKDFKDSKIASFLGEDYAKTKWFFTKDTLFGTNEPALFIGRYVRSMEYDHAPGMLFLKMDDSFLTEVLGEGRTFAEDAAMGILDEKGEICVAKRPKDYEIAKTDMEQIQKLSMEENAGVIADGAFLKSGILFAYRQKESGMVVYTMVPNEILDSGMNRILFVLSGIFLFVMAVAALLSVYFSKRFTKPIQDIGEAMSGFDGNDFTRMKELHTNTELDQIGHSYNEMLGNIERLVSEIKEQEKELRNSELNMLISQINPHFLYNTLDTIYMLARINKEETTMRMIQALSKYLRLSLSKGNDIVTVEDELENVKSYMEIQQIRNADLFQFEVDCQVDATKQKVLKLILQPLVENAIKHGFREIFEGGMIKIEVLEEGEYLLFNVYNSGVPIEAEVCQKINGLMGMSLTQMKECFPDQKNGYGILNIVTRLRLKYEDNVSFVFQPAEDGTWCKIRVPKQSGYAD